MTISDPRFVQRRTSTWKRELRAQNSQQSTISFSRQIDDKQKGSSMNKQTDAKVGIYEGEHFHLGDAYVTRAIFEALTRGEINELIFRHISCDWSDMCEEDRRANTSALTDGTRIFSSFLTVHGKVWVITEADRSCTTVLFPNDY